MSTTLVQNLKIKAIEPQPFEGALNTVDGWIYSLELYFVANSLDFNNVHEKECAAIAAALLRGVALNWHKRLSRAGTLPTTYTNLKAQLVKQFGVLDEGRKSRDALYNLR